MLDFPQFTKDTFPGVTHMDLFSGLFGDVTDDSMYVAGAADGGHSDSRHAEFDPSSTSGKRWLEKMADKMAATGTKCQHISNNAPRDICDRTWRSARQASTSPRSGWTARKILGAKSMRVNSGGPRIAPAAVATARLSQGRRTGQVPLQLHRVSFKEMADHGGKVGVKVTLENHWGLTANPTNIRIIVDEVKQPVLRGVAGLLQLGARVPDVQRPEGAGAVRPHQRPRQVLEPLEGQRREAVRQDHDGRRVRRHLRAGIRGRARGTASKARSISTRKCSRRCKGAAGSPLLRAAPNMRRKSHSSFRVVASVHCFRIWRIASCGSVVTFVPFAPLIGSAPTIAFDDRFLGGLHGSLRAGVIEAEWNRSGLQSPTT